MNPIKNIFISLFVLLVSTFIFFAFSSKPTIINEYSPENGYNIYAIDIPDMLDFSGESMPIHIPDIRERIDRELLVNTYWQSNGLLLFKRAQRYFPIIEPILESYGIPDDFKYLALIESGLQNVTSPAGAKGFWQIMKPTGKEYGLEINSNVDERNNLELATVVACKYLLKSKAKFGNWTLAAASYNAGVAGISSKLERQKVTSYYDLLLGQETGRYMFRIVALKEIITNPKKYGFNFSQKHLYSTIPTYKVEVDTAVTDFVKFALKFDLNYKQLKIHNPWLREGFLNNKSNKVYYLEIPKKGYYN
ncbi:MAG: lytic transglycosylase domain-containing protein [Formosa sp.]|jgi:membrane-bound lytic murein transglycosylase D|nr:lytic transglycosylase domain-containing protein [Formosa sp.]MDA9640241.1 lytic transglycosylase domain-containing protein [Flavobacteriaceae bacterium]MDC0382309.1 lytic transglycosylase domain-containing protein [Flavobacteriaceae bacterium]MDC0462770.1 lytic transglycosylase domain-containing protein [Flavobacteriaceae bacterium]|tara:strand:- start:2350 stop:3267 length:918 start_codon:yes stop_codon:yes gene_type:complete